MVGEHKPRQVTSCDCGVPAIAHRPSHNPKAWPVCSCGARAENHRVKHTYHDTPKGTCEVCNLPQRQHLARGGKRAHAGYKIDFVGLDGEGLGRKPHRYVMLCAAAIDGRKWAIEDAKGLKSYDCLKWLCDTLDQCRVFAYGFGYDITCIIRDLPDSLIYDLLRPQRRYIRGKLRPIKWRGFCINWLQGKLTITYQKKRVVIWDILKFYQQTFVKTLEDWGIDIGEIAEMKEKRSRFKTADMPRMKTYCHDECQKTAVIAQKLLQAHSNAGLTLRSYYGPGSTASVALGLMKVKDFMKDPPRDMLEPIACAFFGGRFEHSDMGIVRPVYAYDISSAYPYHAYSLPCLKHGKWRYVKKPSNRELHDCTTALVRYEYEGSSRDVWAPFPHRDAKGNICYPYRGHGWTWLPEYESARGMGNLVALGAWVYHTECNCRPLERIAEYYRRRSELGKDARGKVLKLAINSIYGKLAQSRGVNPPYQNWIWAGLITSGTRAQVIRALRTAKHPRDIVAIATDGIFSRKRLHLEKPIDTGTSDLAKPLGGWEEKEHPEGILFLKPGIYLTLDDRKPKEGDEPLTIKARGIGRKTMTEQRKRIVRAWQRGSREYQVKVERFYGAKSSISLRRRSERFGQWGEMTINVHFECPNRTEDMGLFEREVMSTPYNASLVSPEALQARLHRDIAYEQP